MPKALFVIIIFILAIIWFLFFSDTSSQRSGNRQATAQPLEYYQS